MPGKWIGSLSNASISSLDYTLIPYILDKNILLLIIKQRPLIFMYYYIRIFTC